MDRILAAVVTSLALGCAPNETPRVVNAEAPALAMPVFSPQRGRAAADENARCESCHREIAAEWRGSLHQTSFVEPNYQRALAIEPLPFCRSCHAPEADPSRDAPEPLASLGVGCVSCHVSSGHVLAAPRDASRPSPHPLSRDARFATGLACASCHEFAFPDRVLRNRPLLMQSTLTEHAQSPFAAEACASCHMPLVGSGNAPHRSHSFSTSRNPEMIRSAVSVTAIRLDGRRVRIELEPRAVGHAFPTGDLFRRVQVLAEAIGPDLSQAAARERYLTRHFAIERRDSVALRRLDHDDRVGLQGKAASVVELDLGEDAERRNIAWRVAYQRVEHPLDIDSDDALLDGEVELGSGILEARP